MAEVGVISKHGKAIERAGRVASTDLAKPENVPLRPPFGVYIVECAGPGVKSPATQLCDLHSACFLCKPQAGPLEVVVARRKCDDGQEKLCKC